MARLREVGSLWIGGALSYFELLCLKSFVRAGQKITLFTYGDVPNVPEGVICRDGRAVLNTERFLKYRRKDSYALFADLFRLHMLRACPGMIWVDTDVYCWRPLDYDSDYVMGFEKPGGRRVNNAVLGLPAESAVLADMLDFVSEETRIPPFLPSVLRADYAAKAKAGAPVSVEDQPWGVWGPSLLSYMVQKHGLLPEVLPMDHFYPVLWQDRTAIIGPEEAVRAAITPQTTGLHLWASNKRELALRHQGVPPPGSFLAALMKAEGQGAEDAPLLSRGGRLLDGALAARLTPPDPPVFTDFGGRARALALATWQRFGTEIDLLAEPGAGAEWQGPYREYLIAQGVPEGQIRALGPEAAPRPSGVIARLTGPDRAGRFADLAPRLAAALAPGTQAFLDIRAGSGGFPLLRGAGKVEVLSKSEGRQSWARVAFTPGPKAAKKLGAVQAAKAERSAPQAAWAGLAPTLAGPGGFWRENGLHSFLFIPRGKVLVVTFDNLDIAMDKREDRRPWGFAFIEKQGWSMLGVMAAGWTWYRDPWVAAEFDRLAAEGFFAQFDRVVFYGASMGGYAAAAFSAACPGADVVAFSPQSTLDKRLVPWERRYRSAWGFDYGGPYGDAAQALRAARQAVLFYDPYAPLDRGHIERMRGANVLELRAPLLGHRLGSSLQQMGILSEVTRLALEGHLTEAEFYRLLKARKTLPRYQKELFDRALAKGHVTLARRLARYVLLRGGHRALRKTLAALEAVEDAETGPARG